MKKLLLALISVAMLVGLAGCSSKGGNSDFDPIAEFGSDELYVFNWGEYIGEDTIEEFENRYNVTVHYKMFDSNEEMYTSLVGGDTYDIIVPSDYMIERLIKEERIQKLDLSLIPNLGELTEGVLNRDFDPTQEYSVPYFQGSVGILYDTTVVSEEEIEAEGWNILVNPKYAGEVFMYDADRDNFLPALKALGYSCNTTDDGELEEAYQWLLNQAKTMKPAYVTDEVNDEMIEGNKALAVVYSGAAAYIMMENEDMAYYEPQQGTNVWCDGMCIPSNAKNVKLAHAWINFNLEKEIAEGNSVYVGYTPSQDAALKELAETEFEGISAYTPRVGYAKDEEYHDDVKLKEKMAEMWVSVKAAAANN